MLSAGGVMVAGKSAKASDTAAKSDSAPKYTPWIGDLDRSKIKWGPTVDAELCIGCGMCMHCGAKVYEWVNKKPQVVRYDKCMTGCTTCMNLCPAKAITFPSLADVTTYLRKEKIYDRIKTILKEQGKIPQDG